MYALILFYPTAKKENNYFLVERPPDTLPRAKPYQVYWNVPTKQCRSKKIPFDGLFDKYGIIQNKDDSFLGEQIAILYDPGLFPAILMRDKNGKMRLRNGGVPQEGNLDEHLTAFRYSLENSIPDPDFNGIAIIDFESWRPVYRQNFGELTPYKEESLKIERRLHPLWTKSMIEARARYRFERAGREFMQATLKLARLLRPRARWGYYGFPYCFNMASNNLVETCSDKVRKENDQIPWLWSESNALYPSVYSSKSLSCSQLASLIRGRVGESARLARSLPILPYFWFKYRDAGFMSEEDLKTALKTMYRSQASGFIIWGSSNDTNTPAKCEKLKNYVEKVLGPAVAIYTKQSLKVDEVDTKDPDVNETTLVNLTTENSLDLIASESKDNPNVDEDNIHFLMISETNRNNTEETSDRLPADFITSDTQTMNDDKTKEQSNSILIDILLSIIENVQKNENKDEMAKEMVKINKDMKKGTPLHDTFTKVSTENYYDVSTRNPFDKEKKKGEIFASLFSTHATDVNNKTTTNDIFSTTDDFTSTSSSLTTNEITTNSGYNYVSTTEIWDDNNTFYNEDTFFDRVPEFTSEATEEDSKSEFSLLNLTTETSTVSITTTTTTTTTEESNITEYSLADLTTQITVSSSSTEFTIPAAEIVSTTTITEGTTTALLTEKNNDTLHVVPANNQVVITIS
ncbi:hypothetical protein MSG28_012578 [Choristoneura fumiferana]|uniref:Uncharacterized protein n=1 Tax=Choristoneura fumiferana TaxID=7141 RepID=A0ACC0JH25_CHOFU|nr:hypothetical protein MSG28_012578 [Choristoneura fumiferana]